MLELGLVMRVGATPVVVARIRDEALVRAAIRAAVRAAEKRAYMIVPTAVGDLPVLADDDDPVM